MAEEERVFPYDKTIVLGALYDALDAGAFVLDRSNSARGTLLVSRAYRAGLSGRIAVSPLLPGGQTLVEVFTDGEETPDWATALLDEATALLRSAGKDKDE